MNAPLRERVLAEWRGLPQREARPDRLLPVGDLLPKVMQSLGLKERLTEAQILGAWREIVGDFLSTHSSPTRVKHGVLYVQVIQSTIRFELERVWKPQIVQKLKKRFGSKIVRDVRFCV